ncbi:MAG: translesion error-prone DNA polymerase V autoproteolytic subunit [Deferrisomatales bacterium]|nr:translesion error-prone DNA polymerase V autoproteolytic subunit [Deferrisomatales bacterium]
MADQKPNQKVQFFTESVAAGFPSPATDYCESRLDLNELCVKHPAATYFVRAQGDSMIDAGIYSGDVLVVDRSLTAKHGDIVIVALNGELTVKKLETKPTLRLVPMNRKYAPVEIPEETDIEIFGVATTAVHSLQNL